MATCMLKIGRVEEALATLHALPGAGADAAKLAAEARQAGNQLEAARSHLAAAAEVGAAEIARSGPITLAGTNRRRGESIYP
eukprot:1195745-Prorocentrum_minimum.AAC.4